MEVVAATNCLIILIFSFLLQIYSYRIRIFLHPSFWFFFVWILSLISFLIYMMAGFDYIIYFPEKLVELFTFISFTAISVALVGFIGARRTSNRLITWRPNVDERLFLKITKLILALGIIKFVLFGGFDMAANRDAAVEDAMAIAVSGKSLPVYQIILNLVMGLNAPLIVLAGYFIGNKLILKKYNEIRKEYFYPFVLALLQTIQIGGRAGIVTTIVILVCGLFVGVFSENGDQKIVIKKVSKYAVVLFLAFSIFSAYVNAVREGSSFENSKSVERWNNYPYLKPFSGLLQYLTDHYPGFQLRLTEGENSPLEWGQNTFSCFFSYNVPVVSQLSGQSVSLQSILGLKEKNVMKSNAERSGEDWANTTGTVFLPILRDFGYTGAFFMIFIFVLYSQHLYNRLFFTSSGTLFFILPFYLVYKLWSQTIFSHHLVGNWLAGIIYIFLIFDLICYFSKRRIVL